MLEIRPLLRAVGITLLLIHNTIIADSSEENKRSINSGIVSDSEKCDKTNGYDTGALDECLKPKPPAQ